MGQLVFEREVFKLHYKSDMKNNSPTWYTCIILIDHVLLHKKHVSVLSESKTISLKNIDCVAEMIGER